MANKITKLIKLGNNIKSARKEKGFSQNEFAEMLDISREHIAKIETAKRGLSLNLLFKKNRYLWHLFLCILIYYYFNVPHAAL